MAGTLMICPNRSCKALVEIPTAAAAESTSRGNAPVPTTAAAEGRTTPDKRRWLSEGPDGRTILHEVRNLLITGVVLATILYLLHPARAVDVFYKAAWIVWHWRDSEHFPPGSNLCTYGLCTRTDTERKNISRTFSFFSYCFCPEHEPGFESGGSPNMDGAGWRFSHGSPTDRNFLGYLLWFVVYWPVVMLSSYLLLLFSLLFVSRLVLLPATVPLWMIGRIPSWAVIPPGDPFESGDKYDPKSPQGMKWSKLAWFDWVNLALLCVATGLTVIAWMLYLWW